MTRKKKDNNDIKRHRKVVIHVSYSILKLGIQVCTSKGETKSLNLYVTSKGFSFSMYNFFKPSMTEVTAVSGIC
jgi:hypothetical protein